MTVPLPPPPQKKKKPMYQIRTKSGINIRAKLFNFLLVEIFCPMPLVGATPPPPPPINGRINNIQFRARGQKKERTPKKMDRSHTLMRGGLFSRISRVRPSRKFPLQLCLFIVMETSETSENRNINPSRIFALVQNREINCTRK